MNKAITDTGPLLHLTQISSIRLLETFDTIFVSGQVKEELLEFRIWHFLKESEELNIQEENVNDDEITDEKEKWKDHNLHKADLSILVLVRSIKDTLILTDDLELRKAIKSLGREVVGSVGILIRGYKEHKLNKDELDKCVDLLFNDSSLYLSRAFRVRVLKLIEELENI